MNNWEIEVRNKINELNNIKDSLTRDEYIEKYVSIVVEHVYTDLKTSIKEKLLYGVQPKPIYEQIFEGVPHNVYYKKMVEANLIEEAQDKVVEKLYTTINWEDIIKDIK